MIRGPGRPDKYVTKDGARVVGTTTVIGRFKDSGALLFWAYGVGKSGAPTLYGGRDEAADAGTLVHSMVEAHIHGDAYPEIPEKHKAACDSAFGAWLQWLDGSKMEMIATELPLVSEQFRFGGTIDAVARDASGKLCIIDFKTSNGVYPDYAIQVAAYGQLWDEHHPDDKITGGFHLCRFAKEHGDFEHRHFQNLPEAWELFTLYRKAYDLDKQLSKRVK